MPGALEDLAFQLARGVATGVLEVVAARGPELVAGLVGAWREAMTSTATDAPTDPAADDAVAKQVQDAIDRGEAPPPDAVLHR